MLVHVLVSYCKSTILIFTTFSSSSDNLQGNQRNTNIITSVLQYNKTKNEPIETLPLFNGQIMDLALLFMRITERGAYREESKY